MTRMQACRRPGHSAASKARQQTRIGGGDSRSAAPKTHLAASGRDARRAAAFRHHRHAAAAAAVATSVATPARSARGRESSRVSDSLATARLKYPSACGCGSARTRRCNTAPAFSSSSGNSNTTGKERQISQPRAPAQREGSIPSKHRGSSNHLRRLLVRAELLERGARSVVRQERCNLLQEK
jgi:hypothetical protein